MSEHLLEVRDLAVSFDTYAGEVQAVRGISYYLDKGETLSIVGESGCGKSVSCQTIMKLLPSPPARIKSGSILYKGEELVTKTDKEMEAYRGKEFSMVFQDSMTSLNPTMRVGRQLCEGIIKHQKVSREKAKEIAIEMLRQVGLPNPEKTYMRYPHTLSGGMRQRVMIAIAIACNPQILFADEPTTALDVTMQAQILDLMNGLKQKLGTAIILITHDLGVVAQMADRIAVMYAGRIVESGTADEIFYNPKHPYTWGLLGSMPSVEQSSREAKSELMSIPGTPPDLFAPPKGCAFAARCNYCMGACLKEDAPEFKADDGHAVHCWLLDPRAPKVIPPVGQKAGK
ncbi:MAG TPA: ABC transporter ATP-binding protein, partial [Candidatus Faecivivens stercoravium]|nr:ABC transporter ATP-binding protein [Candidatus Faecivivens stercoravium]